MITLLRRPGHEAAEIDGRRLDREPYWVQTCHGSTVVAGRRRLGIVEDVLYGAEPGRAVALAVRSGLFGGRVELVPVDEVVAVAPRARRVVVRDRAVP